MSSTWDFIPFWGERHWRLHWLGRKKNTDEQQRDGVKEGVKWTDLAGSIIPTGFCGMNKNQIKSYGMYGWYRIIICWVRIKESGEVAG